MFLVGFWVYIRFLGNVRYIVWFIFMVIECNFGFIGVFNSDGEVFGVCFSGLDIEFSWDKELFG